MSSCGFGYRRAALSKHILSRVGRKRERAITRTFVPTTRRPETLSIGTCCLVGWRELEQPDCFVFFSLELIHFEISEMAVKMYSGQKNSFREGMVGWLLASDYSRVWITDSVRLSNTVLWFDQVWFDAIPRYQFVTGEWLLCCVFFCVLSSCFAMIAGESCFMIWLVPIYVFFFLFSSGLCATLYTLVT